MVIKWVLKRGIFQSWNQLEQLGKYCGAMFQVSAFLVCVFLTTIPTMSTSQPVSNNCSKGWMYFEATQSCYGLKKTTQVQWLDAEIDCKTFDAHLVSIHSPEEAAFVSSQFFFH